MASSSAARVGGGGGGSNRENTAKAIVADQISQAVQSTSNLLRLIQQSSFPQAQLGKLPKNLLDRTATIRNTGQVLEQLPQVISSLDEHMESALRSVPNLKTVTQLLDNMENNQLQFLSRIHPPQADNIWGARLEDIEFTGCGSHALIAPSSYIGLIIAVETELAGQPSEAG